MIWDALYISDYKLLEHFYFRKTSRNFQNFQTKKNDHFFHNIDQIKISRGPM